MNDLRKDLYNSLRDESKALQQCQDTYGDHKTRGTFMALFNVAIPASTSSWMDSVIQSPAFVEYRKITRLDSLQAALGAISICESVGYEDELSADPVMRESQIRKGVEKALEEAAMLADEIEESCGYCTEAKPADGPEGENDPLEATMAGSGSGEGSPTLLSGGVSIRFKIADLLSQRSSRFRKIAELLGRMRALQRQARKERPDAKSGEICQVEKGSDLSRILPSELVDEDIMYAKLGDQALQQYSVVERREEGKGPIVFLQDKSSSMGLTGKGSDPAISTGGDRHTRDDFGTACLLSMFRIAAPEKRDVIHMGFQGTPGLATFMRGGKMTIDQLHELIAASCRGGTSFAPALNAAIDFAKEYDKRADVIMVTDGDDRIDDLAFFDLQDKLKAADAPRLFIIAIGPGSDQLKQLATKERYFNHTELREKQDEALSSIYKGL